MARSACPVLSARKVQRRPRGDRATRKTSRLTSSLPNMPSVKAWVRTRKTNAIRGPRVRIADGRRTLRRLKVENQHRTDVMQPARRPRPDEKTRAATALAMGEEKALRRGHAGGRLKTRLAKILSGSGQNPAHWVRAGAGAGAAPAAGKVYQPIQPQAQAAGPIKAGRLQLKDQAPDAPGTAAIPPAARQAARRRLQKPS